ncbi:transporter substrate-binding domain-containing protein [Aedoeadaptatus pacaensis]|uniref:transporter substrate-binding domain-containing protein n=1 Tax=Aedoeadaptatus pacaensis TaxID=1776390 RepID=UPI000838A5D8|nr:transporter substrate-binding domain-containing protein [Peptoniphilus pacaensis]
MKKFGLLSILAMVMAFALVGCGSGANNANNAANNEGNKEAAQVSQEDMDAAVKAIKDKGKLVLATSADYPPYEWHLLKDGKDEIVGFDIEIAKAIADEMGVELEVKDLDFDGIIPSIASGQADIGIAGLSATPEREEAVNFSAPYFTNEQVVLVRKEDADKYKKMEDFAGKVVGAQTGSIQEETVRENFPKDVELKSLAKLNNLALEVKNKTADALVISKSSGEQYAKQFPELVVIDAGVPEEPGVCVASKKGNDALTAYINQVVQKLIDEGKIESWIAEYEKLADESTGDEGAEEAAAGNAENNMANNAANENNGK